MARSLDLGNRTRRITLAHDLLLAVDYSLTHQCVLGFEKLAKPNCQLWTLTQSISHEFRKFCTRLGDLLQMIWKMLIGKQIQNMCHTWMKLLTRHYARVSFMV